MKLGFIILAHQNLKRVEQLARHLSGQDSASCIHIDKRVSESEYSLLVEALSDLPNVEFSRRTSCEWGRFSIVQATLDSAELLLEKAPDVTNVFLISGSCLPIRPVKQLSKFLHRNTNTDFVESVSVHNNYWVKGGLNEERFSLYFPFSWRDQRWIFDRFVNLQRSLKIERKLPEGLQPHIGSQWWCLTSRTLRKILTDPKRPHYDSYFKASWIPDESYFQTLARKHAEKIESRSLTFSKFDFMGKPYNFYDDHLEMLSLSDCFMARKIWSGADGLYDALLSEKRSNQPMTKAKPKEITTMFERADQIRCEGGEGRFHQGRFPLGKAARSGVSQNEYTVFVGFKNLYQNFPKWVESNTNALSHDSIFARGQVSVMGNKENTYGNLPAEPGIRNRNLRGYLANFLWENRTQHQTFLYDFRDNPRAMRTIAYDPKATVILVRHSWLLFLLNRNNSFERILATARRFHKIEQNMLDRFGSIENGCKVTVLDLDVAVSDPALLLSEAIDHISEQPGKHLQMMPEMHDLNGLDSLIRKLRNNGLKIWFERDRKIKENAQSGKTGFVKPYVVK